MASLPVAVLVFAGTLSASAASGAEPASDRVTVLQLRAETLAADGQCAPALEVLERARELAPGDAKLARVQGLCLIQLGRYGDAVLSLEQAKSLDPSLDGVDLYLGIARYHGEDFEGAASALEAARGRTSGPSEAAQLELYTGLLHLRNAENREAALALESARRTDPGVVEPVASYYAALAWEAADERRRAEEALERVRDLDPDSEWAAQANRALADTPPPRRRFWGEVTVGFEYDSNVVLRGTGVALPSEISGKQDIRGAFAANGGVEILRTENWSGGLMASYTGWVQDELDQFDMQYPTVSGWLDRRFGDSTIGRVRYDFGYAWLGNEPFVAAQDFTASVYQNWNRYGATEFSGRYVWNNFFFARFDVPGGTGTPGSTCPAIPGTTPTLIWSVCGPPGLDEAVERNRDGHGLRLGFLHRYPIDFFDTVLRGGYFYHRYFSRGTEYRFEAHEVQLGFDALLPFELELDVLGRFVYQPFDHPSTFPTPPPTTNGTEYGLKSRRRLDKLWDVAVVLERDLGKYLTLAARYWYQNNISNVDAFDYDRSIVGAYLTAHFR